MNSEKRGSENENQTELAKPPTEEHEPEGEEALLHPAMMMDSQSDEQNQSILSIKGGFQFKWMFCIKSIKISSSGWLLRFFTTQIIVCILNLLVYGSLTLTWFMGKFSLFHSDPEKDAIVIVFLITVDLKWLFIMALAWLHLRMVEKEDKESKPRIVFAAKAILYANMLSSFIDVIMVVMQADLCYIDFASGKDLDAELRLNMVVAFFGMTFALLGQTYMFWHSSEPLKDFVRPADQYVGDAVIKSDKGVEVYTIQDTLTDTLNGV